MTAATVQRHASRLRRCCHAVQQAYDERRFGVARVIGRPAVVGDLGEFKLGCIGACLLADKLALSLRIYLEERE